MQILGIAAANISDGTSAGAYSNFCKGCSTISVSSISVVLRNMYLVLVSVNTTSATCGGLSDTLGQTFTRTVVTHSSTGAATVCAYNEGNITASGTDTISTTGLSLNYDMEVYVYVLTGYSNASLIWNSANDATCSCSPTIPQLYFNYVGVNPGNFGAGAYDSTGLTNTQLIYESGTTGLGAGLNPNQDIGFGGEYFIAATSTVTTSAPAPCCAQVPPGGVQTTTAIGTATVSATITQVRSSSVKSIFTIIELSSSEFFIVIVVLVAAILAGVLALIRVRRRHFSYYVTGNFLLHPRRKSAVAEVLPSR